MIVDPSNAVIAKAKAKYGRRIKEKDYSALVKSESVSEVVRYLKTYTSYRSYLTEVSGEVHRGNVEAILRRKLAENYFGLCRYIKNDSPVTGYLIRRAEINELIKFLTLLSINRPLEYIFSMPFYLNEHTEMDLEKLSGIISYGHLLEFLEGHPYKRILEGFEPDENGKTDIASIDDALEIYSIGELYRAIGNMRNKKSAAQLRALFDVLCDYNNYSRIMRLKRYYNMNSEAVKKRLLPFGTLTGRRLDALLSKESYEDVRAALSLTSTGRRAQNIDIDSEMAVKGRYDKCRHELYFSTDPEVVLLAYYIVSETELKNIVTIIEGVRYSMAPKDIRDMLILSDRR